MTFTHRPLEEKDVPYICAFPQSAEELFFAFPKADFPLTPDALMATAHRRFSPTVVLQGDRVVGYANFIKVKERGFCSLGNLLVHREHRREGVATYLVKAMVRLAADNYGTRLVLAGCFSHNQAAYQMYHKLGFRPANLEQRVTPDGTPVLQVNLYLRCNNLSCDR